MKGLKKHILNATAPLWLEMKPPPRDCPQQNEMIDRVSCCELMTAENNQKETMNQNWVALADLVCSCPKVVSGRSYYFQERAQVGRWSTS